MKLQVRKVTKTGTTSYLVTLPPEWIKSHDKPKTLYLLYEEGGIVLIVPEKVALTKLDEIQKKLEQIGVNKIG